MTVCTLAEIEAVIQSTDGVTAKVGMCATALAGLSGGEYRETDRLVKHTE